MVVCYSLRTNKSTIVRDISLFEKEKVEKCHCGAVEVDHKTHGVTYQSQTPRELWDFLIVFFPHSLFYRR